MKKFLLNIWTVSIGSAVIAGLILFYGFGVGKDKPPFNPPYMLSDIPTINQTGNSSSTQQIINSPGLINTIGQSGGTNVVNITSNSSPNFKGEEKLQTGTWDDGIWMAYMNFIPLKSSPQPLLVRVVTHDDTKVNSIRLINSENVILFEEIPDHRPGGWFGLFGEVPPVNFQLQIIFNKEPKVKPEFKIAVSNDS